MSAYFYVAITITQSASTNSGQPGHSKNRHKVTHNAPNAEPMPYIRSNHIYTNTNHKKQRQTSLIAVFSTYCFNLVSTPKLNASTITICIVPG
mmetsp:Transcript_64243/g.102294  ORF Transcript_64243/g.102294 Transcript_64243/m.102294 type:complete len:93 (-) Transcript_64243:776-1054(-)